MSNRWLLAVCCWLWAVGSFAQNSEVMLCRQREFHTSIPAGNYSGIAWLGGNRYAVVNDKAEHSGFHLFTITIDSVSGRIRKARETAFYSSGTANRDEEGICFFPHDSTVFISGEKDNQVLEYTLDGRLTGRQLHMPSAFATAKKNYGLEALTYNQATARFWTTSELPLTGADQHRLQSFGRDLQPRGMWYYKMDDATTVQREGRTLKGIPAMTALDDGRLLILEREIYMAKKKIGSTVQCKIYIVSPNEAAEGSLLPKTLLTSFSTKINLTARSFANYEGMCLGPKLQDGRQVLILISDSQNQQYGILRDWLKTIVF